MWKIVQNYILIQLKKYIFFRHDDVLCVANWKTIYHVLIPFSFVGFLKKNVVVTRIFELRHSESHQKRSSSIATCPRWYTNWVKNELLWQVLNVSHFQVKKIFRACEWNWTSCGDNMSWGKWKNIVKITCDIFRGIKES